MRRIFDGHVSNFEERVWGYVVVCHFHVCLCSPAVLLVQWMQPDDSELFPSEGILDKRVWGCVVVCHFHICLCSPAVLLVQWMQPDDSELFPSEGILDMRHGCDFKWMTKRMTNML